MEVVVTIFTVAIVVTAMVAILMLTARTASAIGSAEATLFENKDFNNDGKNPGGASLVVTTDISCLADSPHNFDNKTRSIQVNPGTIVTVYEKCGFTGKSETFMAHDSDLADNEIGKDKISSIKISSNDQSPGNDHQELRAQIAQFQQEVTDSITTQHNDLTARIDALEQSLNTTLDASQAQVDTARQEILDFIRSTHLVDPLDMAVNVCASIGPNAEVGETASVATDMIGNGGLGFDFHGSGVSLDYEVGVAHEIAENATSNVSVELQACINGLFFRQDGTADSFSSVSLSDAELELLDLDLAGNVLTGNARPDLRRALVEMARLDELGPFNHTPSRTRHLSWVSSPQCRYLGAFEMGWATPSLLSYLIASTLPTLRPCAPCSPTLRSVTTVRTSVNYLGALHRWR